MQVNRQELITALEICKPALAATNRAAELTHFWLSEKQVSAYNGHLTITAVIDLDIRGGVPATLLDWLKSGRSDTIDIEPNGTNLAVSSGKSKATFVTLDPKRRIVPPLPDTLEHLPISQELVQGLARVIISHDAKSTVPAKLGVFVVPGNNFPENEVELYATDDVTLSSMVIPMPDNWPDLPNGFIVVPIPFIKQIFHYMPMGGRLYLSPNTISLQARNVVITSSLIECPKIPNFDAILAAFDTHPVKIPLEFEEALDRVKLIDGPIQVAISNDTLYLTSSDKKNCIQEEFPLDTSGHPSIMEEFDHKLLKRAIAGRVFLNLVPNGMRLIGPPDFVHLIGAVVE